MFVSMKLRTYYAHGWKLLCGISVWVIIKDQENVFNLFT